jgi:hypothetical protein
MVQLDTNMNSEISKMLKTKKAVYLLDPNEILSAYRREIAEIEGYHGRELLELLQNAVDELESATDKFVCIELAGNTLRFSNNGNVFTKDGITSLMYTNLSPKFNNHKYIGNKGTGFRSVLNWSDRIRIYSGSLSIEFSAASAAEFLDDLLEEKNVFDYKAEHPDMKIATLVAPKVIEPLCEKKFDTVIEISVKDNMVNSVREQMNSINATTLLFLDNLERLTMICDGEMIEYRKQNPIRSDVVSEIVIETYIESSKTSSDEWNVAVRQGKTDGQLYTVAVAYKPDMSVKPDVLYSFFKTKVSFPVPALVHGTFDLDANRNHLNESMLNQFVLEEACLLLIDVTKQMCSIEVNYAPLRLLSLRSDFPNELSWAKLNNFYLDAISESNIFPTVNSAYISFSQDTKYYRSDISDYLTGESFSHLLIYSEDSIINTFIEKLAKRKGTTLKYSYDYIVKAINELLPIITLSERAALCLKFLSEYSTEVNGSTAPQFILDSLNRTVLHNQQIFLPPEATDNEFPQPPDFAHLVFMNKEQVAAFRNVLGENNSMRALSLKLAKLNVNEYGLTEIIRSVVSKFNSREHKDSKNTLRCCVNLVLWLWKMHKSGRLDNVDVRNFSFKIPMLTRERKIVNADTLYIGTDYENRIAENLLTGKNDTFVAPPDVFNLHADDIPKFREFLIKLNIVKFPRITVQNIGQPSIDYRECLIADFKYPVIAEKNVISNAADARNASLFGFHVAVIDNYDYILKNARTEHILDWLSADDSARILATSKYETNPFSQGLMTYGNQWNGRSIAGDKLSCFMRHEFSRIPWIAIDGERFAPGKCLLQGGIGKRLSPFVVVPDFMPFVKNFNKSSTEISKIKILLSEIGAAETYGDISANSLYGILLMLPVIDASGEISKSLYKAVLDAHGSIVIDKTNKHYINFMTKGMVFCKKSRSYKRIDDVWYMTEKGASDAVLKDYNLIAISSRQSQENILKYFGVKSLKLKGRIVDTPSIHSLNQVFASDFYNFKKYAFCYRLNNAKQPEIYATKALKVILCETITANYDKGNVYLSDYDFIRGNDGSIYVKIPLKIQTIDDARMDLEFCAAIAEIFTSAIDIHDENLFTCLRSLYGQREAGRQKMIRQDFDDLHILTEAANLLEHTQSRRDKFLSACEQIGGLNVMPIIRKFAEEIDFDSIDSITSIEAILGVLNILNIDVPEFNDRSEFDIDLRPFHSASLQKLTETYKIIYKNSLYASCIDSTIEEKKKFIARFEAFCNHQYSIVNSTKFDVNQVFFHCWDISSEPGDTDADAQWKRNRETFLSGRNEAILNDLLSKRENESLLYFGELGILSERYDVKAAEWKKQDESEESIKNPQDIPEAPIQIIPATSATVSTSANRTHVQGTGSRIAGMVRERDISSWGAFAEEIVYKAFQGQYTSVEWVSENAKKKGVNPNGIGGLGYDLTYKDDGGETVFVEIKSTTGDALSFVITANELSVAEEKREKYMIALVVNVGDADRRKIVLLPDLFVYQACETRFDNNRFTLSADNYTISCLPSK